MSNPVKLKVPTEKGHPGVWAELLVDTLNVEPTKERQRSLVSGAIRRHPSCLGALEVLRQLFGWNERPEFRAYLRTEVYPDLPRSTTENSIWRVVDALDMRLAILKEILIGWYPGVSPDYEECLQFVCAAFCEFDYKPKPPGQNPQAILLCPHAGPGLRALDNQTKGAEFRKRVEQLVVDLLDGKLAGPLFHGRELDPWVMRDYLPEEILARILHARIRMLGGREALRIEA